MSKPIAEDTLLELDALSGLESAVIAGFLKLPAARRNAVINDYTQRHGEAAGNWLQRAATLWPQQSLGVSRVTLARLFAVLPEHMDQAERLALAKSIWHTARAPTRAELRVPPGYRNHALLSDLVHKHFVSVLPSALELPEALRSSLPWLAEPSMQAQHQVLNLLLLAERDQLLALVDEQIAVLFSRRLDGMEIRSKLAIAGHELLLVTTPTADQPRLILPQARVQQLTRRFNDRAPRSAMMGAAIGGGLAVVGWLLFALLS